ncbi:hypothetical protein [Paenibacillus kyungheensis]
MNKILSTSLAFILFSSLSLHTISSVSANADNENTLKDIKIDYEVDQGQNGLNKEQLIDQLIGEGVGLEDAEYYAKLDILAHTLEKENIIIDLDKVESYSNIDSAFDMLAIREKALDLDERAIKTLFQTSSVLSKATEDLSQVAKSESFASQTPSDVQAQEITVKYADGSSVSKTSSVTTLDTNEDYTTDANWSGPWTALGQDDMFKQDFITTSGSQSASTGVVFASSAYRASVSNAFNFTLRNNGSSDVTKWTAISTGSSGSASAAGFISPPSTTDKRQGSTATGSRQWIQAYTEARFTVSSTFEGSVSIAGNGLSLSLSASNTWNQYAITEVSGSASVLHWEAIYK